MPAAIPRALYPSSLAGMYRQYRSPQWSILPAVSRVIFPVGFVLCVDRLGGTVDSVVPGTSAGWDPDTWGTANASTVALSNGPRSTSG